MKPCFKKMESLCVVRDGRTGKNKNGYHTLGVVALAGENKITIPVYDKIYSSRKVYLMRWRIEEFYKFKKQQFKFEDLRVTSLQSIRNLNLMLTVAIGYIGIMSEKCEERALVFDIISMSKRIFNTPDFTFYAIADGLFAILKKSNQGISHLLKIKRLFLSFASFITHLSLFSKNGET